MPLDYAQDVLALTEVDRILVATGALAPVTRRRADQDQWRDCDLAAFAENHLGDVRDPFAIDRETRDRWSATALEGSLPLPRERDHQRCYWLVHGGERVGTLAFTRFCLGEFVVAHSVYVRPQHRGKGLMAATLDLVCGHLYARGIGVRLETPWTWQPAVRFYLRTGFWLRSWKRDLAFIRQPRFPPPKLVFAEHEATLSVEWSGRDIPLAHARRSPERLLEHVDAPDVPDSLRALSWEARTTLSLGLALGAWPMKRAGHDEAQWSDGVQPEALAHRIETWEAWALHRDWRVETPRIPDIAYRSWDELERAWVEPELDEELSM